MPLSVEPARHPTAPADQSLAHGPVFAADVAGPLQAGVVPEREARAWSTVWGALSHHVRVQIIAVLLAGPATPRDIACQLRLESGRVQGHLRRLQADGFVAVDGGVASIRRDQLRRLRELLPPLV